MRTQIMTGKTPKAVRYGIFGTIAFALVLLLDAGHAARAQDPCAPHAEMKDHLKQQYTEVRIAIAFSGNGQLVEVFSTGDGATWTIVVTTPNGLSCILIAGETWEGRRKVAQGPQV